MLKKNNSSFGKGLTYCLGLFLSKEPTIVELLNCCEKSGFEEKAYELWFNVASDHIFDLQIPDSIPVELQDRLKKFQKNCMTWRFPMLKEHKRPTQQDFEWALKEVKFLLRAIDMHIGVEVEKGEFE